MDKQFLPSYQKLKGSINFKSSLEIRNLTFIDIDYQGFQFLDLDYRQKMNTYLERFSLDIKGLKIKDSLLTGNDDNI